MRSTTHETTARVLARYAYWLTYGEDDEMTDREEAVLDTFLADMTVNGPDGFTFGHYCAEPEHHAGDYGTCEATGSWGELITVTFVFFGPAQAGA